MTAAMLEEAARNEGNVTGLTSIADGENLFDSRPSGEKPSIKNIDARLLVNKKPPLTTPPVQQKSDGGKTLKKTFVPRSIKNYKNMLKYGQLEDSVDINSV